MIHKMKKTFRKTKVNFLGLHSFYIIAVTFLEKSNAWRFEALKLISFIIKFIYVLLLLDFWISDIQI